jgi:hypothetical protein
VIAKSYILENLRSLDYRYRNARSAKEALFCSKLAILELCGWIEESMDIVVRTCAKMHLKEPANLTICEGQIIGKNYGFDYQGNFRNMLMRLAGLVAVEKLEKNIDPAIHASMTAALTSLKALRNTEAHTHLKGKTRTLNAPSVTIAQFQPIYEGLIEFDRQMRQLRF